MRTAQAPPKRLCVAIVVAATVLYAAALIANVTAGAVTGILVGMFISLAACNLRGGWHRNTLLALAAGSWALVTLLITAHCLAAHSPVCALRPVQLAWLPSLFYALCWLAWTLSVQADARRSE